MDHPVPGSFAVRRALQIVQIDHTLADVILVDELYRQPIGRPWITVAFDVATRVVMGFHLSLEPPSATTVALCLATACLPKDEWLEARGLIARWPVHGLPRQLHMDNAQEFHSEALQRGADYYGIELVYRPPGRPHFGGHIERYLGTLMSRLHGLPGTTGSNPKTRGRYPSDARAVLTLAELEGWLVTEICERYHGTTHRALHCAPQVAWQRAVKAHVPRKVAAPDLFAVDFLPIERRLVRRDGIRLFSIRYWDPALTSFIGTGKKVTVRYNPRDLSRVYVASTQERRYIGVSYADLRWPAISLWEQRAARAHLRQEAQSRVEESVLFHAIEKQRAIVRKASAKTKRARRLQERVAAGGKRNHAQSTTGSSVVNSPAASHATPPDYKHRPIPFPGEEWT
jgi:putative transposase